MKKLFFTLCIWLTVSWVMAQQKSNPKLFTGAAALQEQSLNEDEDVLGPHIYLQVGGAIPYSHTDLGDGATISIRYPWDVAYIPLTFGEEYFEVSKGYFSEKVLLNWTIQSNAAKVDQVKVYRRVFEESNLNDVSGYVLIATLSSDSYSYEDTNTQGGLLYEYKVEATGISSIPKKYVTYITGVGYRNPTGVVTGNVSYDGGSPVKDVVVRADPQGADQAFGSSLLFDGTSALSIPMDNKELDEQITMQAWVKLESNTSASLFELSDNVRTVDEVHVTYATTDNSLTLTVAHTAGDSKSFTISDFYPTGNIDGRGDDIFKAFSDASLPQNDFSENFVHLTVVLENGASPIAYLNGRRIEEDYLDALSEHVVLVPAITTSGTYLYGGFETADVVIADGLQGNIDELRLWDIAMEATRIRTDFKRYLGGSEPNLMAYIRADEKAGEYAYDISRIGFKFNKNHARIINGAWTEDRPTSSQLGILGVTDALGNYIISAIPFSGAGESYTITPLFGVHQFEPSQQLVYVGNGSEVINKINFKDISSFDFLGVAYFTTNGVFEPIEPVTGLTPGSVTEAGYNQYNAIIDGNEQLISKGKHYFDESDPDNPVLYETPKVYMAGANIYIDGQIVLDKDNRPVETDKEGFFKIKVPIGNHYIEVKSDKHGFTHGGRFPAAREDGDDLFEFFEHQQSAITFLDTTRVSLVGRVVGGSVESGKPIGFGYEGLLEEEYFPDTDSANTVSISSINNIGQSTITLSYLPFGGTPGIGELEHTFTTNEETGEYNVNLLPLSYTIDQSTGIRINNNVDIKLLTANETVNISAAQDTTASQYENADGNMVRSNPYHFVKNFTYRSTPVLNVTGQTSDIEVLVTIDDSDGNPQEVSISTEGFNYPVYTQSMPYAIVFETFEEYINYDGTEEVVDQVPIVDGEFNITNNLALIDSESLTVDPEIPSVSKYVFRAGLPTISSPFTKTISISYRVDGKDYDARNYETEGIILGGQSDGSQTFVTKAPDVPDIILRDPPGSNSYASIESGKSISFTEEASFNIGQTAETKFEYKMGVKFAAGGGLAGPVIETESVNSITAGVNLAVESSNGSSVTKTYTFTETISTSDDPLYVGSDGDLYIGNTKNYFYGSYDNVRVSSVQLGSDPSLVLTNEGGESIHVSKQKAFYFSEEPSETFFIYSQKHIIETLIPELQGIIEGIDLGTVSEDTPGVLKKTEYEEQIRLWRKVIQDNERTKYLALNDRDNYKNKIKTNIENQIDALNDHLVTIQALGSTLVGAGIYTGALNVVPVGIQSVAEATDFLNDKKALLQTKLDFLEVEFLKNVSFDAGVGEYTNSSEIAVAESKTRNIKFDIDGSLETTFGFELNKAGLLMHTSNTINTSMNNALTEEESESTTVSYTLKDNDKNNFLSIDVVNTFDGNGPVFSTIGGRTSCPYEGIDTTLFYNNGEYSYESFLNGTIYTGGDQISYATQKVEVPVISVEVASVTDVPEERAAEFKLILENNSAAEADAYFNLYVDNTTNPNNAIINIAANGTVVYVPYGQKIEYVLTLEKSISDVYEYNDINIVLGSLCDGSTIYDVATLSAVFRPSCTAVTIDSPLENWVFNSGDAYNDDNTTNPLSIGMFGYNRTFSSFENFDLQYRKSTSSSWTRLRTYYNTQELLDVAILEGEDQGVLINGNSVNYSWDIGALGLADGQYEVRSVSNCNNGTTFVSEPVLGSVDLNVPVQFGTPSPTDGILGAGEDLRLQFSEDIVYSSAISKIEIKGETNQQEVDHNVSVYFEGANNVATIEKPNILPGDFSIEFWMKNQTVGSALLFDQPGALSVALNNGTMEWTFGGQVLAETIAADDAFHHYTLTYSEANQRMKIYLDDLELGALDDVAGISKRSESTLVIGGNTFVGNLHDLRFWSKPLTLSEAYAAQFNELMGSERDLIGYWPMNEGSGEYASDLARFKHAALSAEWDIKPKGTAYDFDGSQYLELDNVDFVQLTDLMDVTLSFWMKTDNPSKATIFSNGRGNGEDLIQSNGKANKWAVSIENGILYLNSDGNQYALSTTNLADDSWHHVTIILRRTGSLRTYIDTGLESSNVASNIGGLSGNKFWIGARGHISSTLVETVDEVFTGKIDELRLWNLARATEQTDRDRFNEVDFNSIGLMLYARMNEPDPVTGSGPKYYHSAANETILSSNAKMNAGAVSYTVDAPKIKLSRPYLTFEVSHVINGDEMIITPLVSDWSVLEGQIIDITVDRMYDVYGNQQASPITWSAYVRRNEMSWFIGDGDQQLSIEKQADEPYSFEVTIQNKGGKEQPYAIENIPQWLSASSTSGTMDPNSSKSILFVVAPELTIGEYTLDLYLDTDFNFDEKLLIDVRILGDGPDWSLDPTNFEFNMNIVGKIKIDGVFSQDRFSKVAAFVGDELRGVANLEYDKNYDEYFLYLNVFSNTSSGEDIRFKIWDASSGKVMQATLDGSGSFSFIQNEVLGYKSVPVVFENTAYIEQYLSLNQGWTWVSIYAEDSLLDNMNQLTESMVLTDGDMVKSQMFFDLYDNVTGWDGSLSSEGGLSTFSMHKWKLANAGELTFGGDEVDISEWTTNINAGWNWLSYPLSNNVSVNEGLAMFEASEGDVIKTQRAFAVYDPIVGWTGTLNYLIAGEGYMLNAGVAQELGYPDIFQSSGSSRVNQSATAEINGWSFYENNMNVIAEVVSDQAFDRVLVLDEKGVERGKAEIVTRDGRQWSYVTVFGDRNSAKGMTLYLEGTDGRMETTVKFDFEADQLLGTLIEPVILDGTKERFEVYPNSFDTELHLEFDANEDQQVEVQMFDVLGHEVYKQSYSIMAGANNLIVEPNVRQGIYLMNVIYNNRKVVTKVIKR